MSKESDSLLEEKIETVAGTPLEGRIVVAKKRINAAM